MILLMKRLLSNKEDKPKDGYYIRYMEDKKMNMNGYAVKVECNPLPRNCHECPFYQYHGTDEDFGYDNFACSLANVTLFGCAIHRPVECPLVGEEIKDEPPTEKQDDYARELASEKDKYYHCGFYPSLRIPYTKKAYWKFISENKPQYKNRR